MKQELKKYAIMHYSKNFEEFKKMLGDHILQHFNGDLLKDNSSVLNLSYDSKKECFKKVEKKANYYQIVCGNNRKKKVNSIEDLVYEILKLNQIDQYNWSYARKNLLKGLYVREMVKSGLISEDEYLKMLEDAGFHISKYKQDAEEQLNRLKLLNN